MRLDSWSTVEPSSSGTEYSIPTAVTQYWLDANRNPVRTVNPLGQVTTAVYDADNRQAAAADALGNRTTTGYDGAGNPVRVVNPLGQATTAVYDADNRRVATVDGLGRRTTYGYDAAGRAVAVRNPLGQATTSVYDTLNRLSTLTNSVTGQFGFGYDALSRRTSLTRPNGVNTAYTYDNLSRLLSVLHQTGAATIDGATYTLNLSGTEVGPQTITGWTITWGDGSAPQSVTGNPASVTHVYGAGADNYTITATATDEDGTYAAGNSVSVAVNNVAPANVSAGGPYAVDDGGALTSRDIKATYDKIIFPPPGVVSMRKGSYQVVEVVEALDPSTVRFRLKWPEASFLTNLASPYNWVYKADILAKDMRWYETNVMGSGPFQFVDRVAGAHALDELIEAFFDLLELLPALGGELVVLGAAVGLRERPLGVDPAALFHAVKSRVERALFDFEKIVGGALDVLHESVAVQSLSFERAENHHFECTREEITLLRLRHGSRSSWTLETGHFATGRYAHDTGHA